MLFYSFDFVYEINTINYNVAASKLLISFKVTKAAGRSRVGQDR